MPLPTIATTLGLSTNTRTKWLAQSDSLGIDVFMWKGQGFTQLEVDALRRILEQGPQAYGKNRWTINQLGLIIGDQIREGAFFSDMHVWTILRDSNFLTLANLERSNKRKPAQLKPETEKQLKHAIAQGPKANGYQANHWTLELLREFISHRDEQHRRFNDGAIKLLLKRWKISEDILSRDGARRLSESEIKRLREAIEQGSIAIGQAKPWALHDVRGLVSSLFGFEMSRGIMTETIDQMYEGGIGYVSKIFTKKAPPSKSGQNSALPCPPSATGSDVWSLFLGIRSKKEE